MGEGESNQRCPQCNANIQRMLEALRDIAELSFCVQCHFPLLLVANKYRLQRLIGRGGFGEIYLAHHVHLSHDFERVVKVLKPEVFAHKGMEQRFQREVHVTSMLSRENNHIVRIYDDFGEISQWGHFYVMEYLKGVPLTRLLEHPDRLPPLPLCFHIFRQLCEAMEAAHRHGVVHRDIKPDNIFLVRHHRDPYFVKVIDFGIAKPLDRVGERSMVATQGVVGTPLYMAPEQWEDTEIDHRTDIYAMGVVLYEMLTGRTPFWDRKTRRAPHAVMLDHLETPPPRIHEICPNKEIPPAIEQLLLRSLGKHPTERFPSVQIWRQELEHAFVQHDLWPSHGWKDEFDPETEWGSIDRYFPSSTAPSSSRVANNASPIRPAFSWPRKNSEEWQRQRLQSLGQWREGMAYIDTHPVDQQVRHPSHPHASPETQDGNLNAIVSPHTQDPKYMAPSSGHMDGNMPSNGEYVPKRPMFSSNPYPTHRSGPYNLKALHPPPISDPAESLYDLETSQFQTPKIWLWASMLAMLGILVGGFWLILAIQETRVVSPTPRHNQSICGSRDVSWPKQTLRVLLLPIFSASSPPLGTPQQIQYRQYMQRFFAQTLQGMIRDLGSAGQAFLSLRTSEMSFADSDPQRNQAQARVYGTNCGADLVLSATWLTSPTSPIKHASDQPNLLFGGQRTWLRLFATDTRTSSLHHPSLFPRSQDMDELLQVAEEQSLGRSRILAWLHGLVWLKAASFVKQSIFLRHLMWERAKASLARVGIPLPALPALPSGVQPYSEETWIPKGPFFMGSSAQPQTKQLAGFWIDRYEVSREAYAVCILKGQCPAISRWLDPPWTHPRDRVKPEEAQAFCQSLGKKLPTEEQWIKAARGGLTLDGKPNPIPGRPFVWGKTQPDCRYANLNWCFKIKSGSQDIPIPIHIHHILLDRSVYGVYHLMGNVSEILRDGSIKGGNGFGEIRPISWKEHMDQRSGLQWIGFRCVREPQTE